MTNLQQRIEEQVGTFVRNVSELIRRAAIEALEQAIVVPGVAFVGGLPKGVRAERPRQKPRAAKRPAPPREPAELAALTERLYGAIAAQPGETIEVLAPTVGCPGKQLRVSIEHLLKAERVRKAGVRRSTRYFPMGGDCQ
jgi:hypothetical protein